MRKTIYYVATSIDGFIAGPGDDISRFVHQLKLIDSDVFAVIFTKADKLKPKILERQVEAYIEELLSGIGEETPQYFVTSSSKGSGRNELLDYIEGINTPFFKEAIR